MESTLAQDNSNDFGTRRRLFESFGFENTFRKDQVNVQLNAGHKKIMGYYPTNTLPRSVLLFVALAIRFIVLLSALHNGTVDDCLECVVVHTAV